jgi:hypothetical protein
MYLTLTDPEVDYLYRLLLARPMGEVETLVVKIRAQVAQQQKPEEQPAHIPPSNGAPQEVIQ